MNVLTAKTEYALALLFAAEVTEAITRPGYGDHGVNRVQEPFYDKLMSHQSSWDYCDNRQDLDLAATGALRATVQYLALRQAESLLTPSESARSRWPDVDDRLAALRAALDFAAVCAEDAWRHELGDVLSSWYRERSHQLLSIPDGAESLIGFEARIRHAVNLCQRYRVLRHELFGDRHWTGRPAALWSAADTDLVAKAPFDGYARGDAPVYALRLRPGGAPETVRAEFTIANLTTFPATGYHVTVHNGVCAIPADLAGDDACVGEVRDALAALAVPTESVTFGSAAEGAGSSGCQHLRSQP